MRFNRLVLVGTLAMIAFARNFRREMSVGQGKPGLSQTQSGRRKRTSLRWRWILFAPLGRLATRPVRGVFGCRKPSWLGKETMRIIALALASFALLTGAFVKNEPSDSARPQMYSIGSGLTLPY